MSRRHDERAQMILLAGILLVIAYLVFSTQSALLATVGQEAGREVAAPLYNDFSHLRLGLAEMMRLELTDSAGVVQCPVTNTEWKGRVETLMAVLGQLEGNRGLSFHGDFGGSTFPIANEDADVSLELVTNLNLYLTDGDGTVQEQLTYYTECE